MVWISIGQFSGGLGGHTQLFCGKPIDLLNCFREFVCRDETCDRTCDRSNRNNRTTNETTSNALLNAHKQTHEWENDNQPGSKGNIETDK